MSMLADLLPRSDRAAADHGHVSLSAHASADGHHNALADPVYSCVYLPLSP